VPESESIPRHLAGIAREVLSDEPVLILTGARQVGKTTLIRGLAAELGGTYVSLDEPEVLAAARADPMSIMRSVREPIVIDEFQRAPEILLAVKTLVDRHRAPGRFILTGSTRFMSLPKLSETLAGRAAILELWPFSVGETLRLHETFIDDLFSAGRFALGTLHDEPTNYLSLACRGGFPVILDRSPRSAARWLGSYVTTVTQRDVLELSRIQRGKDLLRILKFAAARTATVLNMTALAADAGQMPVATVSDYLALLESVYLVRRVPAWSTNLTAKVAHHPKLHVTDTGLGAFLLGLDVAGAQSRRAAAAGPLLETFVVNELEKQLGWSKTSASLFHFRDRSGVEVDAILETRDGRIAAVEVKVGTRVDAVDLRGLELLRDRLGDRFVRGVVLFTGSIPQERGDRLSALPMRELWRGASRATST
jgi:uncharacterized protein